jgi:hypothetical protein
MNLIDVVWLIVIAGAIWMLFGHSKNVKMKVKMRISVEDMKIGHQTWLDFCHLAALRRKKQPELLGEAINFYLENKVR